MNKPRVIRASSFAIDVLSEAFEGWSKRILWFLPALVLAYWKLLKADRQKKDLIDEARDILLGGRE